MSFQLVDIKRSCRIWPNVTDELKTGTLEDTFEKRLITFYLFPLELADPTEILYIEDNDRPLYRAGTYLYYGAYTESKTSSIILRTYLIDKNTYYQKIISNYHIKYLKNTTIKQE